MFFGFHTSGHHASTHQTAICIPNIQQLGYPSATRPSNPSSTKVSLGGCCGLPTLLLVSQTSEGCMNTSLSFFGVSAFFKLKQWHTVVLYICKTIRPSLFFVGHYSSHLFLIHMFFGFHIAGQHASTHWTDICIPNIHLLGYTSATRPSNPSSTKASPGELLWAPYTSFSCWT